MTIAEESSPSEAADDSGDSPSYSHREILLILSGLGVGMFLAALDQTIVATALTRISEDFHRVDLYGWVITSYLLTSTASTPLFGKISDQFGRKRIFQASIVMFLVGSALSGLSQSMYQLIAFRAVQGLGAGGLVTLAYTILGDVVPPRLRGRYQGYFGAVFTVSSVVGPLIGGFFVDQASWRWVFYVNLPIGAAGLVLINRVLKLDHKASKSKVDFAGAALLISGVSLLLVGVQVAGTAARITNNTLAFGIPGLILIAAFILWETRAAEPIVTLKLFRLPVFVIANATAFISGVIFLGALIFLSLYMQSVRGTSPTMAGLRLIPIVAGLLLTSVTSGRVVSRTGRYKTFVIAGTAIVAFSIGWMATISVNTSAWTLAAMMFVAGCGMGLFMQLLTVVVQNSVPPNEMGVGTAAVTFFRSLGGAIGSAVLGAVLVLEERDRLPHYSHVYGAGTHPASAHAFTYGMDRVFLYVTPLAVLAFLLSLGMREVRLRSGSGKISAGEALG